LDSGLDEIPVVARTINGDGIPVLIVSCDTGGNGVGHDVTLLIQLGPQGPRELYFGAPCTFHHRNNGKYDVISSAVYSGGSTLSDAVYVTIPLVWNGHRYATSAAAMAKPKPSNAQITTMAGKLKDETAGNPRQFTGNVMSAVVDLICSG